MPSPFPGMDPYLESPLCWSDFHHEMISAIRSLIRVQLPLGFVARVEERLYLLDATVRPDIRLQVALERAFDAGGYDETIDYSAPPIPSFTSDDAMWADALLREKGYR